ncbi:D-aminoacyl-tRNA deacylase [Reinekea marina]|uniref:D-aminoacyl-tRNA deacylase n=1 Tax=Reinekea marina TaxID=1310421 RepID=A0ABV7WQ68_9GAMM|nr:D-aminoacyl-tRNA deacylase [Reinekea marina]MDN3647703.1 D-aminoacyl-tRNA deacylase [Reinekea marina]
MKALVQRVVEARVEVDGQVVGAISQGMLVLIGIDAHDNQDSVKKLSDKLLKYRIFADDSGKMNLNVQQINGQLLLVSQFTLSADTHKGLRPGFSSAATPEQGRELFDYACQYIKNQRPDTQMGVFGADMQVFLQNDGPVTFLLEN